MAQDRNNEKTALAAAKIIHQNFTVSLPFSPTKFDELVDFGTCESVIEGTCNHFNSPFDDSAFGYVARSACHFLISSGLSVAVYNSISRTMASGIRVLPRVGI